jgi:type II secretory pathway component PulJ
MSKESINDIASKATAGSTSILAIVGIMAWQQLTDIKTDLKNHIQQTTVLIQELKSRVETLERKVGEMKGDMR